MSKNKSIWLVIFISTSITAFIYSDIFFHLNDFLFSAEGDGLKNYFNYLYHIKHDSSYFSFEGMSYPYGETIFMVDAHPLFSNVLKFISQNIVDLSHYSIGILNFTMLISITVSSIFLFLILDIYKFPWYIAISGAISIAFLASNVMLWKHGHYALSYSSFFPIAWFLILKYQSSDKKIKYSIFILLNTLFWFYTHTYLGLIILGFTFAFHLFSILLEKKKRNKNRFFDIILQVFVPAIFVYLVIYFSDTHFGRIEMPYTTGHRATIYSVFFPNHSYLRPIYSTLFDLSLQENQSWCKIGNYIGFSTNIIISGVILFIIFKLVVLKKWILNTLLSKNEIVFLLSVIVLLMFSAAIPFQYNLEFLLPNVMKQFVALGRIAWAFYFVIIVISFILISKIFKRNLAHILIMISIFILFTEGLSYHLILRDKISVNKNIFNEKINENIIKSNFESINFSDYQAIVPIPFYHKYISLHAYNKSTPKSEALSMNLSYVTGLPLMSAILSRPSVLESRKVLQLFMPTYYKKKLINDLNEKPILIIYSKQEHTYLESEILKKSTKIFSNNKFELYKLPIDSIYKTNTNEIKDFIKNSNLYTIDANSGYYSKDTFNIFYDSFDKKESSKIYRGTGALFLKKKDFNIIFKSKPYQFDTSTVYNLSYWYYNYLYDQSFNSTWIEVKDSTNKIIKSKYFSSVKSNIYDGNWAFNEVTFEIKNSNDIVVLCSKGSELFSDSIYFDELLIRPQNQNIYKIISSKKSSEQLIIKNNEVLNY